MSRITPSFVECECTGFVDVLFLANSNYVSKDRSSTSGFSHLDAVVDFDSNYGTYILAANFGIFIVFGLIAMLTDKFLIESHLFHIIKEDLHGISLRSSLESSETV